MDLVETAVICALVIRSRRRKEMRRQFYVHPIYSSGLLKGTFYTLYEGLREHPTKFSSYFRVSVSAFDELDHMHAIKTQIFAYPFLRKSEEQ
jgi:hypothetical protein